MYTHCRTQLVEILRVNRSHSGVSRTVVAWDMIFVLSDQDARHHFPANSRMRVRTITAIFSFTIVAALLAAREKASAQTSRTPDTTTSGTPLYGGRDFDTWVHLLVVDLDQTTRWQAVGAIGTLGRHGREEDAFKILSPLVRSPDALLAQASHSALAELNDAGVRELAKALHDESYPYREGVINALQKAGPRAKSAADTLVEVIQKSDIELRRRALRALLAIGEPTNAIISIVEQEIQQNDDQSTVQTVIFDLTSSPISYDVKEHLLIKSSKSGDRTIVHAAIMALAKCGKPNDAVRTALRTAVRAYAADPAKQGACPNVAADGVNVDLVLPVLIEVAEKQNFADSQVRDGTFMRFFVSQVGELGEQGRPAVPTLLKILAAHKGPRMAQVDANIIQSLGKLGAGAKDALPVLEKTRQELVTLKLDERDTYGRRDRDFRVQQLDRSIKRIKLRKAYRNKCTRSRNDQGITYHRSCDPTGGR